MKLSEKSAWLALFHLPGLGNTRFNQILDHCGSALRVIERSPEQLALMGFSGSQISALHDAFTFADHPIARLVAEDLAWSEVAHHTLLLRSDSNYPPLLAQIADAPAVLYVEGDPETLLLPQIAIVGSRNSSRPAIDLAHRFSAYLAGSGVVITSGLALGIDGAAHQGAIHGKGRTIAVMATGIDRRYPARHADLALEIGDHGALVTEFPLGTQPRPHHFPKRNRIISGLSMGVLVIEAGVKSGSLITARTALEQGREVFAVPGSIHNPLAKGCHHLIKQGAKLVESADDIVEELQGMLNYQYSLLAESPDATALTEVLELEPEEQWLVAQLGYDPLHLDELVARTGKTVAELSGQLVLLELKGAIAQSAGGYVRCGG